MKYGITALAMVLGVAISAPAQADTYVYKDVEHGYQISFPDSWTVQTADTPTTQIRVAGPLADDLATCRVKATPDGRTLIYPKRHMDEAVKEVLTQDFWEHEINQFENAVLMEYSAPASLGQGDASAVRAYYDFDGHQMYTTMAATIYDDTRYTVSCAAKAEAYDRLAPVMGSIMGSFQLEDKYHPFKIGYYRDFLSDKKVPMPKHKPRSVTAPRG